ncbi:flagellar hook-basal body protein [Sulfoacidibacillus ferrooxidans]|uniref:Flagellar basal-body rod protein FlgG n=1 Tax=Sulfoacidibacillus ferrooxidans TaxID=2005001 RepID=A0A9X1VCA1_9BACL|nr:flagellar hook basal-body protein [Sulfoacidibacillus ferrooxidans]MCI0183397.1 Flagellar basal-body rod protein FlgG [Sulfoacidibacillus ferrooxidans]
MSLLSVAGSGLLSQSLQLDTISNNIANVNTPGYASVGATFEDNLTQVYGQSPLTEGLPDRQTAAGLWLGDGAHAVFNRESFANGSTLQTQDPLDMAVVGDGFFTVGLSGGRVGYTRAGHFIESQDAKTGTAFLALPDGSPVLSTSGQPLDMTGVNASTVSVAPDGILTGVTATGTPVRIGQLGLAYVSHPGSALYSVGNSVYALNPGYAVTTNGTPGAPTSLFGQVKGSMLEGSNVNLNQQMSQLVQTQQAYEMSSDAINIANKMMGLEDQLS